MQIYLLRHGQAGSAPPGMSDSDRRLTPEGEQQVRNVARRTLKGLPHLTVLSSPYKRALQTAEIALSESGITADIGTTSSLLPEASPSEAWAEVRAHRPNGPLLLTGHEPLFSALAAFLVGTPDLAIEFGTATMACIEIVESAARPHGVLKWLMPARLA